MKHKARQPKLSDVPQSLHLARIDQAGDDPAELWIRLVADDVVDRVPIDLGG